MRASCGGTFLPPRKRGSASDTPVTRPQRGMNIGASSIAWISTAQLLGGGLRDGDLVDQPAQRGLPAGVLPQEFGDGRAQARHRYRQLVATPGRFAEPERDGRRHAVRVLDPHHAALDALDAIALV